MWHNAREKKIMAGTFMWKVPACFEMFVAIFFLMKLNPLFKYYIWTHNFNHMWNLDRCTYVKSGGMSLNLIHVDFKCFLSKVKIEKNEMPQCCSKTFKNTWICQSLQFSGTSISIDNSLHEYNKKDPFLERTIVGKKWIAYNNVQQKRP